MKNLDMIKVVTMIRNGRKIDAIKHIRENISPGLASNMSTEDAENMRICLRDSKKIADCISDLLQKPGHEKHETDLIDLVKDHRKDAGLYMSAWNALNSWVQNQILGEIETDTRRRVTLLFRKKIRDRTQYTRRQS
jgi:hypothetical protein